MNPTTSRTNNKETEMTEIKRTTKVVLNQGQANCLRKIADITKDMERKLVQIESQIESVRQQLANGYHVNSLGHFQSTTVDFDRMCALRENYVEMSHWLECEDDDVNAASMGTCSFYFVPPLED